MGTNTACEQVAATMPATPFATAACIGCDNLKGSIILKATTFDLSNTVRNRILAGMDPIVTVPKPLYRPGIPSFLSMPLMTEKAFLSTASCEATCSLVFTTAIGYSITETPVNIPAPKT